MERFRIQLLSDGAKSEEIVAGNEVAEHLRKIGLEWKTADYFHSRTAVLLIQPHEDSTDLEDARARIAAARGALEL